jgi:DNA-directed RNA polymerase delta subunit
MELTKKEIKYIEENLKEKTIVKIARELSEGRKEPLRRRDIIKYFKENFDRDLFKEKFGGQ